MCFLLNLFIAPALLLLTLCSFKKLRATKISLLPHYASLIQNLVYNEALLSLVGFHQFKTNSTTNERINHIFFKNHYNLRRSIFLFVLYICVMIDAFLCTCGPNLQVCQWLATGRWFSPGTPIFSTNKTDRHDISEILLKVALNTIKPNQTLLAVLTLITCFCFNSRYM